MNFSFENLGTNTFLVYSIQPNDEIDTMSLGMLTNNHIAGFAPVSFMQMDTTKYIKYNVSAKVSVQQLFSGPVNKKRLIGVFSGVVEAMLAAEDYMLDTNAILLDTNYIFADVTTCETELVCLPVMNVQNQNLDLATFFKNILFTTQFDQTENCDHVAQLINYLNTNPTLVLADFKELLRKISGAAPAPVRPAPQPVPQPVPQAAPVRPAPQPVPQAAPVRPAPQPVPQPAPVRPAPQPAPQAAPVRPAPQPVPQPARPVTPPVPPKMPVPPMPNKNQTPPAPQAAPANAGDKPMSWFYLMQHYNAENAAIYKAQQEAKKGQKAGAAPAKPAAAPAARPQPNASFAVPGQQAPNFAVPGQPAPQAAPARPAPQSVPQPAPARPAPQPMPQTAPARPAPQPVPQPAPQPAQPVYQQPAGGSLNFGETTVLNAGIGETTVLSASVAEKAKNDPHLIRTKNNEKIPLNKPVFRIGKERSYVDYFISDNTAVSRSHANIVDHNGEFFVVDTNSTNHTYVNGGMIQSGVETKLSHGTKLRFANEEFEFKMY